LQPLILYEQIIIADVPAELIYSLRVEIFRRNLPWRGYVIRDMDSQISPKPFTAFPVFLPRMTQMFTNGLRPHALLMGANSNPPSPAMKTD